MRAPILKTDRLTLRPLKLGDTDALVSTIFGDPDIGWRYGLVSDSSTPEQQRATALDWIEDANAHWSPHGWGAWAICVRGSELGEVGRFIGFCGFFTADDPVPDHELAYGVAKDMWGKGVATEATRACLRYIFTEVGVHRVETVAQPRPTKSATCAGDGMSGFSNGRRSARSRATSTPRASASITCPASRLTA